MRMVALVFAALCSAGQAVASAQSKPIVAETYYNTFSRAHTPLARIRPGETVATKTIDASGRDETGTVRARPSNPLTGPFYVEGAEPGDALVVRFSRVRMNRNWGWSSYRLGLYSLSPESIEGIATSQGSAPRGSSVNFQGKAPRTGSDCNASATRSWIARRDNTRAAAQSALIPAHFRMVWALSGGYAGTGIAPAYMAPKKATRNSGPVG